MKNPILVLCVFVCVFAGLPLYSQVSSTAPLTGVVQDPTGAIIPGVSVTARNSATNARFEAITIENGTFVIPALTPGVYTVTVSLPGFKQAVVNDVKIEASTPANVRVTLQIGNSSESISVEAGAEILQTQTATVTTTINIREAMNLPVSRNALEFTTLLPGVSSTDDYRDARINGLARYGVNISIDGINSQEYNKDTDFFSYISPRTDAIEEVTISTAAPGAESSGQGAVHVKMVTRQGSNEFHGGLYYYVRNAWLNANSWFNNRNGVDRPRLILNQYGFTVGGPIRRDRAFFFVNFEEIRQPGAASRSRDIMHPRTQQGFFRYASGTREVNLLALAAQNGQTASIDPIIGRLLTEIRSATATTGTVRPSTEPNEEIYSFTNKAASKNRYPTMRFDLNITPKHHLETSYWYQRYNTFPDTLNNDDPSFPGFPNVGGQDSDRFSYSVALRSTLTSNLVNEGRFGFTGGTVRFSPTISTRDFTGPVANQGGFDLQFDDAGFTNPAIGRANSRRNSPITTFSDTLNWQRSRHSLSFGATFTEAKTFVRALTVVPQVVFGVDTNDPAQAMFTTANFPGASNTDLTNARNIYALLTGRVTSIAGNATVDEKTGEFVYLGEDVERGRQREWGFFAQDSWRFRPDLTLNYGVRWEIQQPYTALNNRYTTTTVAALHGISGDGNLFRPGVTAGTKTELRQLKHGEHVYATQYGNFAPSIGFAWSPKFSSGTLRKVFGGEAVLRAGYSIAHLRRSNSLFNEGYDGNPGSVLTLTRSSNNGNLVSGQGADRFPLLLREPQRLGPPAFDKTPRFPFTGYLPADDVTIFDPHFKVPYVQSWTLGIQREFGSNAAIEIRYVGNKTLRTSETVDLNEVNLVANRFIDEFKAAQANLQANIAAGRGNTFRYAGAGTGTSPLPILFGYLVGAGDPNNAGLYSTTAAAAQFSNTTFVNRLAAQNPTPYTLASDMYGNATRRGNALAAGLPRNLFLVNPDLDDLNVIRNGGYLDYNSLQIEFRRRLTRGLMINSSYVWSKTQGSDFISLTKPRVNMVQTTHIPHVFKANWLYELPIGRGRRFFSGVGSGLERLVGGWQFHGVAQVRSGDPLNVGNVRLVGMTRQELQRDVKIRFDDDARLAFALPADIIENTIRAHNVSATSATGFGTRGVPSGRYIAPASGPACIDLYDGDCGTTSLIVHGPPVVGLDITVGKKVAITESTNFEFRAEMYNALNFTNFNIPTGNNTTTGFGAVRSNANWGQVTGAESARSIQLIGRINF